MIRIKSLSLGCMANRMVRCSIVTLTLEVLEGVVWNDTDDDGMWDDGGCEVK